MAHAPIPVGHAEADPHAASGGLPQLDFSTWPGQIFWLAITFGVLYFALSRIVLPRIGAVIEDRRDKIADDLDEAARVKRQAEDAAKAYEQSLADARARSHAIAGEARDKVSAEIAIETATAEREFAGRADEAEARIRDLTDTALANVVDVASEAASSVVERLIGEAPQTSAVRSAVDAASRQG